MISFSHSKYRYFRVCDALLKLEIEEKIAVGTMLFGILPFLKFSKFLDHGSIDEARTSYNRMFTHIRSYENVLCSSSPEFIVAHLEKMRTYLSIFLLIVIRSTDTLAIEMCISHLSSV